MSGERERFSAGEVAVVLSRYDVGIINAAREFARGSRRSPKLVLVTGSGGYILKRRAKGRDDPETVGFTHDLIQHLRARKFPAPMIVPTRTEHGSSLIFDDRTYELFEFVRGEKYDESLDQTTHAGRTLARFHLAVSDFSSRRESPEETFHDNRGVRNGLNSIPTTTAGHDSVLGREAELLSLVQELHERYDQAAAEVNRLAPPTPDARVTHGDWHPGNMLFKGRRVAVVLDYDSARIAPRVFDVANGMLQFSILRGSGEPSQWPEFFDESRMRRFLLGYLSKGRLEEAELLTVPHLMMESLIAESVVPIAATGSFGPLPGFGVLQMVRRKTRWLDGALSQIREWLLE
jgi:Ser/Thr protein kinase RdoA (MazF antagonist)